MSAASTLALHIVAATLMGEAGGEPVAGMDAVAQVITVRMEERELDAVSVCLERRQFCVWNGGSTPVYRRIRAWEKADSPAWRRAKEMAGRVITGVYPVGKERFNHFYNPARCAPAWRQELTDTRRIGKHLFGRID